MGYVFFLATFSPAGSSSEDAFFDGLPRFRFRGNPSKSDSGICQTGPNFWAFGKRG